MSEQFIVVIADESDNEITRGRMDVIPQVGWVLFVDGKDGAFYECLVKTVQMSITPLERDRLIAYTLIVEAKTL